MTYLGAALKRRLYPTVLCYHGCVARRQDVLTFREAAADIRTHVRSLQAAGYRFLKPSEYKAWQQGLASYDQPVTCINFDDGLQSIDLAVPWLIEQGIPCGLALITRRLGKYDPDTDFIPWRQVGAWVATGMVEVLSHTHNLHHLALLPAAGGGVEVAPLLEGPCWVDDGDVVYRLPGDTRFYWDFSFFDEIALAVPLWGTDQWDITTPITTTLTITPKASGSVSVLRMWMALSRPYGSGYDATVQIRANGTLVWTGTISPKQYATRAQWVEREFYSITLDTPFSVTAGTPVALEWKTLNSGDGVALLYALPTSDVADFHAVTNCRGLFLEGSQGGPGRSWQYIDYPPGDQWPVMPGIVLGFGTGAAVSVATYQAYVAADCAALESAVATYLTADWAQVDVWTAPLMYWDAKYNGLSYIPVAGQPVYVNGAPVGWNNPSKMEAVLPLQSASTISVDSLLLQIGRPEDFFGGDSNTYGVGSPPVPWRLALLKEAERRSYSATFNLHIGNSVSGPWTKIGVTQIYRIAAGKSADVDAFTLTAGVTRYLRIEPINQGPTTGTEQKTRWPVQLVTALVRTAGATAPAIDQVVYPFGSYYADGAGAIQQRPGFNDISANLKSVFTGRGYTHGYTIQAVRNTVETEVREPDLRQTEWALGRWIVFGDQAPEISTNNLAALSGYLFRDVPHRGVKWQVSLEADPLGNATLRSRPQVLDYVAFDAWGFDGAGAIVPDAINDGGTYGGTVYADDKGWLQARGVRCLLIINNNLGTGEPDPDIGSHVVNNPATYVPLIVDIAVDDGWDGITCNLEAIPAADRAAASTFYAQLARALHAVGKLLHATVPAATGTAYDAEFWTGWCDHLAIVRVCDAVKVMSYTETGPGTDPGPAAPQTFWDAVYRRLREVIPEPYWPRILCGTRSFGHRWDLTAGTTDFISYHQGIAGALEFAKRIDVRDTEAGWGTDTVKAWFGTPDTVDRAQREAARSFGGLGRWRLDTGDNEEFFPAVRQIERTEDMSFMDVLFPEDLSYGSAGGPMFNTSVVETQSGDSARNARWSAPLHEYDPSLRVRTTAQLEAVRAIFMAARGKWRSFRYKDWNDCVVTGQTLGTADGVITNFQLVREYVVGAESLTRVITKPRSGSIVMYRNGVVVTGWTANYTTGLVSFSSAPAAGTISADFQFDVPVRFDVDSLPAELIARNRNDGAIFNLGTIRLVEVRA